MYTPNKWIILKIEYKDEVIYKVFASWYGGYNGSDRWRINSGIVKIEETDNSFKFYGYSGSCYECMKDSYGTNSYSQNIINYSLKSAEEQGVIITIMSKDTNWIELI